MKKKEDWQPLFFAFIEESYNTPFEWGKWDCCKFSDACIKAITGKALIPKDLKWKDEETAMAAIKSYGGTLGKAIDKAAMRAGRQGSKEYLEDWRRQIESCQGDPQEIAENTASELENEFSDDILKLIVKNKGIKNS